MIRSLDEKFLWTQHSKIKMRHYRLTESRVKRVIRHPTRVEEGILEGAIAAMSPAGGKRYSEIWVMYLVTERGNTFSRHDSAVPAAASLRVGAISTKGGPSKSRLPLSRKRIVSPYGGWGGEKKIKVITAWRYPGRAPERDPIPVEILREIRKIL